MKKPLLFIASLGALGLLGYHLWHSTGGSRPITSQAAATAAAPAEEDGGEIVATIVHDLQGDDSAARERARARLAALAAAQRNWLKIRLDGPLEDATRELLTARLDAIEEQLATEPLAVSLHVKDATLVDVIAQLQAQMHGRMQVNPAATQGRYTLDVDRGPFWDVMLALNAQSSLGVNDPFRLAAGDLPGSAAT